MCCLQEGRAGKFLTGDELSHGDLAVFCNLSTLQSGWLDGGRLLQQMLG
jgi:glutathione S-transferase